MVIFFSLIVLIPAFFTATLRNPIYSVLCLILVFFNLSILLICMEVEFLALIFLVVYVGAIAVLFLFVVMMLNVSQSTSSFKSYMYMIGAQMLILSIVLRVFYLIVDKDSVYYFSNQPIFSNNSYALYSDYANLIGSLNNVQYLAQVLYTYNFFNFFIAGLILLMAMIGSIALTIYHREDLKRQLIFEQVEQDFFSSLRLVNYKYKSQ